MRQSARACVLPPYVCGLGKKRGAEQDCRPAPGRASQGLPNSKYSESSAKAQIPLFDSQSDKVLQSDQFRPRVMLSAC
jgi:hypothetical protein